MNQVEIANRALALLGANKINNLGEQTEEAKAINNMYKGSLKSILNECCWWFAKKRKMLNLVKATPAWGNGKYFQLPPDLIRIFEASSEYELEGEYLLTDADEIGVLYTFLQENTEKYTPEFIDAFACRLAYDVCYDITNSTSKQSELMSLYLGQLLPTAMSKNARAKRQQYAKDDAWISSIFGGANG